MEFDSDDGRFFKKKGWPEVVGSGLDLFVSESRMTMLQEAGLVDFTFHPAILPAKISKIRNVPNYFVLGSDFRVEVDSSDDQVTQCEHCGRLALDDKVGVTKNLKVIPVEGRTSRQCARIVGLFDESLAISPKILDKLFSFSQTAYHKDEFSVVSSS